MAGKDVESMGLSAAWCFKEKSARKRTASGVVSEVRAARRRGIGSVGWPSVAEDASCVSELSGFGAIFSEIFNGVVVAVGAIDTK